MTASAPIDLPIQIPFDNSYSDLPERLYTKLSPTPVARPELVAINRELARELGIDAEALASDEGIRILAGSAVPSGADPLAQVYAGHQFGGWVPQLGDGRAILLGEVVDSNGVRRDIQLKGSGPTPYSRGGDGRAWLGPVIREYLVSEAMHALGVPTTRALAAVTTGEIVQRETALPGAVFTRVASTHVRVGTFQFFASRQDKEALAALTDYVIARHYPDASGALELLDRVIERQARLIARWMGVGFIHGVMNTDNTQVAGETIDYGPCAFMDRYHPETVFSSIDHYGRYAYARQPEIAAWNLAQLASCLLPLIDNDQDKAVAQATAAVNAFAPSYRAEWLRTFRAKIGLASEEEGDTALIEALLAEMAKQGADFTNTFRGLADGSARHAFAEPEAFDAWSASWQARRQREGRDPSTQSAEVGQTSLMSATNPAVIPRNHRVEQAIQAAVAGDYKLFRELHRVLGTPFVLAPEDSRFTAPPQAGEEVLQTFCGT